MMTQINWQEAFQIGMKLEVVDLRSGKLAKAVIVANQRPDLAPGDFAGIVVQFEDGHYQECDREFLRGPGGPVAIGEIDTTPTYDPYVAMDGHHSFTSLHIDPRDRTAWVSQEYKTGSTLMSIYYRLRLELGVQWHPDEAELREYLQGGDGQDYLRTICDGFEEEWNGSNMVGRYDDDAESAIAMLQRDLGEEDGYGRFQNKYQFWSVDDWVDAEEWGLSADSSDQDIETLIEEILSVAKADNVVLSEMVGLGEYLRGVRQEMIDNE